jgi:hypothetical protein
LVPTSLMLRLEAPCGSSARASDPVVPAARSANARMVVRTRIDARRRGCFGKVPSRIVWCFYPAFRLEEESRNSSGCPLTIARRRNRVNVDPFSADVRKARWRTLVGPFLTSPRGQPPPRRGPRRCRERRRSTGQIGKPSTVVPSTSLQKLAYRTSARPSSPRKRGPRACPPAFARGRLWHEQGASALTPAGRKDHAIADCGAQSPQVSTRGAIS